MAQNQERFESYLWQGTLYQLERNFIVVHDFLNDKQAQDVHLDQKYKNKTTLSDQLNELEDSVQFLPDGALIFRRQMLVLLITYLEQIRNEFLASLLIAKGMQPNTNIKKPLEKIEELSGTIIPPNLKALLLEMIDKRNVIIHHRPQDEVDETFIQNSIDAVRAFIELLKSACLPNNIMDVSSWDE